jgi:AcrR family transcriptional regulator
MSGKVVASKPSARERLLAAADELFYREGVQSVGVDRIVQQAGVAKASLYNLFGSKEELVQAYLDARHDTTRLQTERTLTRFRTPREKLLGVFDAQGQIFTEPDFNGCAHISASAEARPGGPVEAGHRPVPAVGQDAVHGPGQGSRRRRTRRTGAATASALRRRGTLGAHGPRSLRGHDRARGSGSAVRRGGQGSGTG